MVLILSIRSVVCCCLRGKRWRGRIKLKSQLYLRNCCMCKSCEQLGHELESESEPSQTVCDSQKSHLKCASNLPIFHILKNCSLIRFFPEADFSAKQFAICKGLVPEDKHRCNPPTQATTSKYSQKAAMRILSTRTQHNPYTWEAHRTRVGSSQKTKVNLCCETQS